MSLEMVAIVVSLLVLWFAGAVYFAVAASKARKENHLQPRWKGKPMKRMLAVVGWPVWLAWDFFRELRKWR